MSMQFATVRVNFDSTKGSTQSETGFTTFPNPIINGNAALQGYFIKYSEGDRNVWQIEISINTIKVEGSTISFTVDFLLRDSSGEIDNPFEGWVDVLAIAEC